MCMMQQKAMDSSTDVVQIPCLVYFVLYDANGLFSKQRFVCCKKSISTNIIQTDRVVTFLSSGRQEAMYLAIQDSLHWKSNKTTGPIGTLSLPRSDPALVYFSAFEGRNGSQWLPIGPDGANCSQWFPEGPNGRQWLPRHGCIEMD